MLSRKWGRVFVPVVLVLLALSHRAEAVPSFARQTGISCATCHTVFPELTPFGRQFKLDGYTLSSEQKGQTRHLQENYFPPLSAMFQVSYSATSENQPGTQNGTVLFPDQMSLFYAGRVSDKLGAFLQATYAGEDDHFSMDNADIRFADSASGGSLTYGLTLNNSPTVQDLWNSTPVWGFPYAASEVVPAPEAATQLDGTLGQQVAGLGAYGFWKNHLYGEITFYRSSQIGVSQPLDGAENDVVDGNAPYWRIAYETTFGSGHVLEIGALGMIVDISPAGTPPGGQTNDYRDKGVDFQYQHIGGENIFTLHGLYLDEDQDLNADFANGASSSRSDSLTTARLDATYYHQRTIGGTLGYFTTNGDTNPLRYDSRTGEPDSSGWVAELNYLPWLNTKFSLQYTAYDEFNGASSNYDGAGRDAGDNNSLYLLAWLLF